MRNHRKERQEQSLKKIREKMKRGWEIRKKILRKKKKPSGCRTNSSYTW